jgi:integrase
MMTGLRRSELAGLKWQDIHFQKLEIDIRRSGLNQGIGRCKTEASQKPAPLDKFT